MALDENKLNYMFSQYYAARRLDRVAFHISRKNNIFKRVNIMKRRYYYPATVHRQTTPSDVQLVKNTALNTLNNELLSDSDLLNMMCDVKKRMVMQKARFLLQKIFSSHGAAAFQSALAANGVNEDYDEEDDPDYEEEEEDEDDDSQEEELSDENSEDDD